MEGGRSPRRSRPKSGWADFDVYTDLVTEWDYPVYDRIVNTLVDGRVYECFVLECVQLAYSTNTCPSSCDSDANN
jgi:hypothetical protein